MLGSSLSTLRIGEEEAAEEEEEAEDEEAEEEEEEGEAEEEEEVENVAGEVRSFNMYDI